MASTAPEQDEQMLDIGKKCSKSGCSTVDYLPFKCHHCSETFCQEHFAVEAHDCEKYDKFKHNRVAPDCPFCNTPVAIPPNADPNVILERHFEQECPVYSGKTKKKSLPVCSNTRCGKTLFSPISCDKCHKQFCPAHRFPSDHTCSPAASPATAGSNATSKSRSLTAGSRLLNLVPTTGNKQSVSTAPINKVASESSTSKRSVSEQTSSFTLPVKNPFNKTDKRAKAERESRRKALQDREKKGMRLTEEERQFLAAEAAAKDEKDCIIM